MYDLMQGIQSGMLKLDPQSMNKAIIAKIKSLSVVKQSPVPRVSETRREVENGIREMQDLERALKDKIRNSSVTHESLNND